MSYDSFAKTFSQSRKNHPWPELDTIIEDMKKEGYTRILDVGCGNGRFLEEIQNSKFKIQNYLGLDSSEGMIEEARKLHPDYRFEVCSMESILNFEFGILNFDVILFLASFHHLDSLADRRRVLEAIKPYLSPGGSVYMTNWNLLEQEKYAEYHRGNGDFAIKIGAHSRYYHGFTLQELETLFGEAGYAIIEHTISPSNRNIYSKLKLI